MEGWRLDETSKRNLLKMLVEVPRYKTVDRNDYRNELYYYCIFDNIVTFKKIHLLKSSRVVHK